MTEPEPDADGSTRLLLVRHGESTWNADGRWQGQADPPLSALGEQQAADAAVHVDAVDTVWSSDLVRARRTAEIIARERGVDVHIDARLRERDAGEWQGYTRAEIEARWPGALDSGDRPAGYESDDALLARVLVALDDIGAAHEQGTVLVVVHGGVVRALERHFGDDLHGLLPNLGGRWLVRGNAGGGVDRDVNGDGAGAQWSLGGQVLLLEDVAVTTPEQI